MVAIECLKEIIWLVFISFIYNIIIYLSKYGELINIFFIAILVVMYINVSDRQHNSIFWFKIDCNYQPTDEISLVKTLKWVFF